MPDVSDDALMRLFQDGDEPAFHVLFERYRALTYNYARMLLRDDGRAEDVLQETFLAVARTAKRYEPRGHFRTWLFRIVRNRCLNRLESERLRRTVAQDPALTLRGAGETASLTPSPAERAQAAERLALVQDALRKLPERQREAVVLYAFDSMTYQEIGDILEVPINTVKTIIHRGRAALARAVEQAERDSDDLRTDLR